MDDTQNQHKQLVEEFDKLCLEILVDGVSVAAKDSAGDTVIVKVTPPGKTLDVIRNRIKDLGVGMVPARGTPSGNLIEAAQNRGLKFRGRELKEPPPLDTEGEDAATA
jgi:hypothetical protein